jgi:hypothetical protein
LTEFTFPPEGASVNDQVALLVANINLALQRDYPAQRIYDEVMSKFSAGVREFLKLWPTEQCVATVGALAPSDWLINSPKGVQVVTELHGMLLAK